MRAVPAADFRARVEALRPYLVKFASLQLRQREAAEDAVQETLLAALGAEASFAGRADLRTWLTGILKHKIVDAIRRKQREPVASSTLDEEADLEDFEGLFRQNGAWQAPPADWGDPEQSLSRQQFFDVMQICLDKLPPNTARVFMMREVLELSSEEICKELTITANNLWVILYRARMSLRECLEMNWFSGGGNRA